MGKHRADQRKSYDWIAMGALCAVIIGLCVLCYPVIATAWNNHLLNVAAHRYMEDTAHDPVDVSDEQYARAVEWNKTNTWGQISDPWTSTLDRNSQGYASYQDQLNRRDVMAMVVIPSINVNLPVRHGSSEAVLSHGLGHLYGTALPVGGVGTHAAITGHTGMTNATMFDRLTELKKGDAIYVAVSGRTLKYDVIRTDVVLPEQTDLLAPVEGQDLLTLVTCTPYGVNSHRLLVTGQRVDMDPRETEVFEGHNSLFAPWMVWTLVVAGSIVCVIIGSYVISRRKRK